MSRVVMDGIWSTGSAGRISLPDCPPGGRKMRPAGAGPEGMGDAYAGIMKNQYDPKAYLFIGNYGESIRGTFLFLPKPEPMPAGSSDEATGM